MKAKKQLKAEANQHVTQQIKGFGKEGILAASELRQCKPTTVIDDVLTLTVYGIAYRVHKYDICTPKEVSVDTGSPNDHECRTIWIFRATSKRNNKNYIVTIKAQSRGWSKEDLPKHVVLDDFSEGYPTLILESGRLVRSLGNHPVEVNIRLVTEEERRSMLENTNGRSTEKPTEPETSAPNPVVKKRAAPFSQNSQKKFATLWANKRRDLGRAPYMRDFISEHVNALKEHQIVTVGDGKRIREAARKNGFIPKWNRTRKKRVKVN
jgi:hypothetical protein